MRQIIVLEALVQFGDGVARPGSAADVGFRGRLAEDTTVGVNKGR